MTEEKPRSGWRVIGKSIRGASHVRAGLPNQDAIYWLPKAGVGPSLILAISDGHGSAKSFRSDTGALLAVRAAATEASYLRNSQRGQPDLSTVKRVAEERLPKTLVRRWESYVRQDLKKRPFSTAELDALEEKEGQSSRRAVEANPLLAYGATTLTVLATRSFALYLQLGDGDILTVSEAGEVSRPLPKDDRLFAGETTSLCPQNAWRDFRMRFQVFSGSPPALILVSTDGYANSFRDEESFLKVGPDLLGLIRSQGTDGVSENLETWLTEASQVGSGDDITLGILCRIDALGKSGCYLGVEQTASEEAQVSGVALQSNETLAPEEPTTRADDTRSEEEKS